MSCSLYQGLLVAITGVTVTPPVPPPPPVVSVSAIVVVRVSPPPVPVIVTVTGPPVTAVVEAANVTTLLVPVVEPGLKLAVTPLGSPLALNATLLVKPDGAGGSAGSSGSWSRSSRRAG
jgi:hypothetical protein